MLLGALLGLVGREKEAAIRDMFETQACMEFIFLLYGISMRHFIFYFFSGKDLSNQFLLKIKRYLCCLGIDLRQNWSVRISCASGRHESAGVDVRHFESERNNDRE